MSNFNLKCFLELSLLPFGLNITATLSGAKKPCKAEDIILSTVGRFHSCYFKMSFRKKLSFQKDLPKLRNKVANTFHYINKSFGKYFFEVSCRPLLSNHAAINKECHFVRFFVFQISLIMSYFTVQCLLKLSLSPFDLNFPANLLGEKNLRIAAETWF